jgi:hypothetical protein
MNYTGIDASGQQVADLPSGVWDRAIKTNLYASSVAPAASSTSNEEQVGAAGSST